MVELNGNGLVLLTAEAALERAVGEATRNGSDQPPRIGACRDLDELARHLEAHSSHVALVDVDPEPMATLSRLEALVRRFDGTRFVVLCSEFRNELVLEAMQIGARHCLVKSALADELPAVLARLTRDVRAAAEPAGRLITVVSAKGGCGGTTIAINTADEMQRRTGQPVLLVDLDLHYGSVAPYLGLESRYSVRDILEQRERLDRNLITSTACKHTDDLHVLVSPVSVDFSAPNALPREDVSAVLPVIRDTYPFTVVDAPRLPIDLTADLARASLATLLVFELSVIDVRHARTIANALVERGVGRDSIVPVANRHRKRGAPLDLAAASRVLGGAEVLPVSNDYENAMRSINFGEPLSKVAARSALRKDLGRLVELVRSRAGDPREKTP